MSCQHEHDPPPPPKKKNLERANVMQTTAGKLNDAVSSVLDKVVE